MPFEGCTFRDMFHEIELMEAERALPPGIARRVLDRFNSESKCVHAMTWMRLRLSCPVMLGALPSPAACTCFDGPAPNHHA